MNRQSGSWKREHERRKISENREKPQARIFRDFRLFCVFRVLSSSFLITFRNGVPEALLVVTRDSTHARLKIQRTIIAVLLAIWIKRLVIGLHHAVTALKLPCLDAG
jgi:hypothetical protein